MTEDKKVIIQISKFSRRIYLTSYLILVSIYSAWYNNLLSCLALSILVFTTSVLYWSNPINSWRRNLDITCVSIALIYQVFYLSWWLEMRSRLVYLTNVIFVLFCYGMARYHGRVKLEYDMASRYHMGVHLFANISNLVLYDALGINYLGL